MTDNSDELMIRFHNYINTYIYGGGNVSHILNVNINKMTTPTINDNDIVNRIRKQVFHTINNVPITFNIKNTDVVITWRSNKDNLNYYHADVMGMYGDVAVKLHTEMLLKLFDDIEKTRLAFMVSKRLVRTIPISHYSHLK